MDGEAQGYDDQFNDGNFAASARISARSRPQKWPKSTSEMRNHTDFGFGGMSEGIETGYSDYMSRRPYNEMSGNPPPRFQVPFWNDRAHPKNDPWRGYQEQPHPSSSHCSGYRWLDGSRPR